MGKHDARSHQLHISKKQKFVQPKPPEEIVQVFPGKPLIGTNAKNQFR